MTNSTFLIDLLNRLPATATRQHGRVARQILMDALDKHHQIQINLASANITPSFADECFAGLVELIGFTEFKRRVSITQATAPAQTLIKHVIGRRLGELKRRQHYTANFCQVVATL